MTHTSAETEKAISYSKRLFFFILRYFPESGVDEFEMYPVMTETARPDTGVYGNLTEGVLYCFGDVGHEE